MWAAHFTLWTLCRPASQDQLECGLMLTSQPHNKPNNQTRFTSQTTVISLFEAAFFYSTPSATDYPFATPHWNTSFALSLRPHGLTVRVHHPPNGRRTASGYLYSILVANGRSRATYLRGKYVAATTSEAGPSTKTLLNDQPRPHHGPPSFRCPRGLGANVGASSTQPNPHQCRSRRQPTRGWHSSQCSLSAVRYVSTSGKPRDGSKNGT